MNSKKNLALFKEFWKVDAFNAMKEFDQILRDEKDEEIQKKMSAFVANQLRKASRYKQHLLILMMTNKCSLFTKLHLSMHFRPSEEAFPRFSIFYSDGKKKPPPVLVNEQFIKVYGTNKNAQLGSKKRGISCPEPVRLNFPQCRKIEMDTDFTLFLKMNGELYISGLTFMFLDECKLENIESDSVDCFDEPRPFPYCQNEEVIDIALCEDYSVVLTKKYIYIFGEYLEFYNYKAETSWKSDTSWESKAGKRFEIEGYEEGCEVQLFVCDDVVKVVYGIDRGFKQVYFHRGHCYYQHDITACNVMKVVLSLPNKTNKMVDFSCCRDSIETSLCGIPYACKIYLNGRFIENKNIVKFVVSEKGDIFVQFKQGIMAKGKVELVTRKRKPRNGWKMGSEIVVVFLHEMAETYGVTSFSASPDCENLIIQFGTVPRYWKKGLLDIEDSLFYWNILHDDFEKELLKEPTKNIENSLVKVALENLISCQDKWQKTYPTSEPQSLFVAIQECSRDLLNITKVVKLKKFRHFEEYDLKTKIRAYHVRFRDTWHCDYFFENFTQDVVQCMGKRSFPEDEATKEVWKYIYISIRMMKNALMENGECIEKKYLNGEQVENIHYTLKLDDIIEIRKNNQNTDWPLAEHEIPLDLDVILHLEDRLKSKIRVRRNETLFRMMHPQLLKKIDGKTLFVDSLEFVHIFYRGGFIQRMNEMETYSPPDGTEVVCHRNEKDQLFCKLKLIETITDLFPQDADPADLWTLNTTDEKFVKVHKNLLLLHSLFIRGQTKSSGPQKDDEPDLLQKQTQSFDVPSTEQDTIEALIAVLDPLVLFEKTIFEVMEIVMFYDFMGMVAARDNAIDVVFQKASTNNLPCLYRLFDIFGSQVMNKFVEYEYLISMMCIESMPPLGLIKALEEIKSKEEPTNKVWFEPGKCQNEIAVDDITNYFIDLSNDHEPLLIEAAKRDFAITIRKPNASHRKSSRNSKSQKPPIKRAKLSANPSSSNVDNN